MLLASLAFPLGFIAGFWLFQSSGSLALSVVGGLAGLALLPLLLVMAQLRLIPLVVRER